MALFTSLVRLLAGRLGTVEFLSLSPRLLDGTGGYRGDKRDWGPHGAFEGLCWEMPAERHLFPSVPSPCSFIAAERIGRQRKNP